MPLNAAPPAQATLFPTYQAVANGPKADFPASGPMYDDAFNSYPPNPSRRCPATAGTGGNVNIMSIQLFPPPDAVRPEPAPGRRSTRR